MCVQFYFMQPQVIEHKNPFDLRLSSGKQIRVKSVTKLKESQPPSASYVAKKDALEAQLFEHHVVKTNMHIQNLLKRLHAMFIHEKVKDFYAYYFMNQIIHASEQKISDSIIREIEELRGKRSYFHVIANSIKARENCLRQLNGCLENLFASQDDQHIHHLFKQELQHYRQLTSFVVGHIKGWKEKLNAISPELQYISYQYRGEDYLIKLMNDCEFLFNSFLAKHLKFSFKNDPYVMRPYVDGRQSKFLHLFAFSDKEKNLYMNDMNFIAEQRAKYLSTKINSRDGKMKEIQKIYHTKENPLSSRIFIRKLDLSEPKTSRIDYNTGKKSTLINNFQNEDEYQTKKAKITEMRKRTQKMKRIKQIFGKTSEPSSNKLINHQILAQMSESMGPSQEESKFIELQKRNQKLKNVDYESNFEKLLRKKEMQVLNEELQKTKRSYRTVKIKDELSTKTKYFNKQQHAEELQSILNELQKSSPQKFDDFILAKKFSPQKSFAKQKDNQGEKQNPKSLFEKNEQIFIKVRNDVIKEIQQDKAEQQIIEKKRRQQNMKIQEVLQSKIKEETLTLIQKEKKKSTTGREELARQFSKPQLFGYDKEKQKKTQKLSDLQRELKKEIQLGWLKQVQAQLKRKQRLYELQDIKRKEENDQINKLKQIEQKKEREKRYEQIEQEQRLKARKKQIQLEQEKQKQIEEEMKNIIERQKQKMEEFAVNQRKQVQGQLKQQMKNALLLTLQTQRLKVYDDDKKKEEAQETQKKWKDDLRGKLEEQYKIQKQMKQNRQKQEKAARLRVVKDKIQQIHTKKDYQRKKAEKEEVKKDLFNEIKNQKEQFPDFRTSIFPKEKSTEDDKKKLREQFEIQLFAFRKPEAFQPLSNQQQQQQFIIKDFKTLIDKEVQENMKVEKNKKTQEKQEKHQKVIEIKDFDEKEQLHTQKLKNKTGSIRQSQEKSASDKFQRFSASQQQKTLNEDEFLRIKLGMSQEEYLIYKKKKTSMSIKRDFQNQIKSKEQRKQEVEKVIDEFQKMELQRVDPVENQQEKIDITEKQSQKNRTIKVSSQQVPSIKNKQKRDQPERRVEQIHTINSRISSAIDKKFLTSSDSEKEEQFPKKQRIIKNKSKSHTKKSFKKKKKAKIEDQQQSYYERKKVVEIQPQKMLKTFTKIRKVSIESLKEFIDQHYSHLPKSIKRSSIYKRTELEKFLRDHQSFTIMEYIKQSVCLGLAVVALNQNKKKYRSLNILHLGAYDEEDLLVVLLGVTQEVFKVDPCEQIALSLLFEKSEEEQVNFMKKLENKFDPYGSIFEKKIFNTQYERKLLLRRGVGQNCRNILGKENRGIIQLGMGFFMGQKSLTQHGEYPKAGYQVGCNGMIGHYLAERTEDDILVELISRGTETEKVSEKNLGYLAKLALSLKRNESFQRLWELKQEEFSDVMTLNLELNNRGMKMIAYPPQLVDQPNKIRWFYFEESLHFSYDFYSLKEQYECRYLRLTPNSKRKTYCLTSSMYSGKVYVLPTKSDKYKIFIADCQEYDKLTDPIPLDMYMQMFMGNLQQHEVCEFDSIWIPEVRSMGKFEMDGMVDFGQHETIMENSLNLTFTDFLGNSLQVQPTHRDLFVSAPFIFGVLNMQIQKFHEGSPIYIQRLTLKNLHNCKLIPNTTISD